jgi:hypothetical protein
LIGIPAVLRTWWRIHAIFDKHSCFWAMLRERTWGIASDVD